MNEALEYSASSDIIGFMLKHVIFFFNYNFALWNNGYMYLWIVNVTVIHADNAWVVVGWFSDMHVFRYTMQYKIMQCNIIEYK